MTVSTDGILAYGLAFDEEAEFPWTMHNADDGEGDIEGWWRHVRGYVDLPEPEWGKKDPETKQLIRAYFDARREWEKQNPMPVELVRHCSGDYPMWILAVPGTVTSASRGYPEIIDPATFDSTPDSSAIRKFCEEFGIEPPSPPAWYLCSLWW